MKISVNEDTKKGQIDIDNYFDKRYYQDIGYNTPYTPKPRPTRNPDIEPYDPWDINSDKNVDADWQKLMGVGPGDRGYKGDTLEPFDKNELNGLIWDEVEGLGDDELEEFNLMPKWYQQLIMQYDPSMRAKAVKGYSGSKTHNLHKMSRAGEQIPLNVAVIPMNAIGSAIDTGDPAQLMTTPLDMLRNGVDGLANTVSDSIVEQLNIEQLIIKPIETSMGVMTILQYAFLDLFDRKGWIDNVFNHRRLKDTVFKYSGQWLGSDKLDVLRVSKLPDVVRLICNTENKSGVSNFDKIIGNISINIISPVTENVFRENSSVWQDAIHTIADYSFAAMSMAAPGVGFDDPFDAFAKKLKNAIVVSVEKRITRDLLSLEQYINNMCESFKVIGEVTQGSNDDSYTVKLNNLEVVKNSAYGKIISAVTTYVTELNVLGSTAAESLKALFTTSKQTNVGENINMKYDNVIKRIFENQIPKQDPRLQQYAAINQDALADPSTLNAYQGLDKEGIKQFNNLKPHEQAMIAGYDPSVRQQAVNRTATDMKDLPGRYSKSINTLNNFNSDTSARDSVMALRNQLAGTGFEQLVGRGVVSATGGTVSGGAQAEMAGASDIDHILKKHNITGSAADELRRMYLQQDEPTDTSTPPAQATQAPTQPPVTPAPAQATQTSTPTAQATQTPTPTPTPPAQATQEPTQPPVTPEPTQATTAPTTATSKKPKEESVFDRKLSDKLLAYTPPMYSKTDEIINNYFGV